MITVLRCQHLCLYGPPSTPILCNYALSDPNYTSLFRPSLIERHNIELRREAARKEALCFIASSVYGGRQDWAKAAMKDGLFDEVGSSSFCISLPKTNAHLLPPNREKLPSWR